MDVNHQKHGFNITQRLVGHNQDIVTPIDIPKRDIDFRDCTKTMCISPDIPCMEQLYTYIYHKHGPHVAKYSIYEASGTVKFGITC